MNFDLLLVQKYDLFRRFDTHFVSGADFEKYWADYSLIAHTCSLRSLVVPFQERMHLEKIRLEQIQNGRLSAIIHYH